MRRRERATHHGHLIEPMSIALTLVTLCGPMRPAASAAESAGPFDVLIRGGRIIDGTGAAERAADVGIRNGRIAAIGDLSAARAPNELDARDHLVCPGFVDLHTHVDRGILTYRDAENYIRQGVTTLVCGNCGSSPTNIPEFARELRKGGTGPNIVMLLGHGSVRGAVIGQEAVAPTATQLDAMRDLTRRAMEAGAVGLSTGLRYRLGAYAQTDEVIAVAGAVAPYGGLYATHMRDEGTRILEAFTEALQIGRAARVPVHISHHKISSASVWGLTQTTLERIDEARAAGLDVTLDQYPYGAGSSGISLMVPQDTLSGGVDAFRKRIADPQARASILQAVETLMLRKLFAPGQSPSNTRDTAAALARIQIASGPADENLDGMNLQQILESRKTNITLRAGAALIVELVAKGARAIYHTIEDRPDGDADRVMRHAQTCIASDGSVFAFGADHPHPRSYGTYPRVLARYVRERNLLTWEEAIHKMTGLPARRLGWTDRGHIAVGQWADLVVFDPKRIRDRATFQDPHRYAEGVSHVLVRGEFVLRAGRMTGRRPGRPIVSVPVATTPVTRLRRNLLEMLQRHDGRYGLYARVTDGRDEIAINADDPFTFNAPDRGSPQAVSATLREWTHRLARANRKSRRAGWPDESSASRYLRYSRWPGVNGGEVHMCVAYDGVRSGARSPIERLIEGPLLARLRQHFTPSTRPDP